MRDRARFPVAHCKLTETALRMDCKMTGRTKAWQVITLKKLIPMSPVNCLEISSSGRAVLFNRTLQVGTDGIAGETQEEKVNLSPVGDCPDQRGRSLRREAYTKLTVRKIMVWKRQATESLTKRAVALGGNNILPNFVAGGMDAMRGTFAPL
jgi:hypothetical protein